ncbi:MAG: citrate synthase [Pseudomonadota bacterium]|nr:citrate synthase [Pseudomonadota bacterium]
MTIEVEILYNGNSHTYPVRPGNLGSAVVDLSGFHSDFNLFTLDRGFKTTASTVSSICYINGEEGELLYRGYPIEELAEKSDFLTVCYLLFYGELPTADGFRSFLSNIKNDQDIPSYLHDVLACIPPETHPMCILSTLISTLSGALSPHLDSKNLSERYHACIQIIAKMPVIVAMIYRHRQKLPPITPSRSLPYVQNLLYMMTGEIPTEVQVKAMDVILTLHADHEQNASTTTVRGVASTGASPFSALVSGISALSGPAHGGANEACIRMLQDIEKVENIDTYLGYAKDRSNPFRLMGFGHRVYKNYDPRAKIMKKLCYQLLEKTQESPLFHIARALEKKALSDPYCIAKNLYPNVDFYSGITQKALGVPVECFTMFFALARSSGWMAHWLEQVADVTNPIFRPRQLYIGSKKRHII